MSAVLFDTHAFIERLTAVGMPEAQAEVLADQQARLIDERLATKSDIAALAAETKSDVAALAAATKNHIAALATKAELRETEPRLETKIEATKADILKWMFGQTLVIIGVIMALLRFGH